jgi:hypothetical protein
MTATVSGLKRRQRNMLDDRYSYPYAQHPAYSPLPDYTSPQPTDWTAATPGTPLMPPGWTPFGAQLLGDTAYSFLQSFVAWVNAIRPALGEGRSRDEP